MMKVVLVCVWLDVGEFCGMGVWVEGFLRKIECLSVLGARQGRHS